MKLIFIRLGSGIDSVETNQDPIITDFDVTELNCFCSLLTGKHCVANSLYIVYQHHKLISSAGDNYGSDLSQRGFFIQLAVKVLLCKLPY